MWGEHIKALEQIYVNTRKMPQALLDRPVLSDFLQPYYKAFCALNKRRQYGMAEQPLQLGEISKYAEMFQFDTDMDFFYQAMEGLDEEYLMHMSEKRKHDAEVAARNKA